MSPWMLFAIIGLVTYGSRAVFILALGDRTLPERVERIFPLLGPIVLVALTTSLLTSDGGAGAYVSDLPAVVGTVVAVVVAIRYRSFIGTTAAAMGAYWVLGMVL